MLLILGLSGTAAQAENWPSWRGPLGDGTTPETRFPTRWTREENVAWRAPLPDRGNSSPVVWKDLVFITQAVESENRRSTMAFRRSDGQLVWQKGVVRTEKETTHEANPHCSASPVTDGQRVVVSYASGGVVAYDFKGNELWTADLGPQTHGWGQGSSPVLHGERVFVYHGPGPYSALYALDKTTGKVLWKTPLPESQPKERFDGFAGKTDGMIGSFATPIVFHAGQHDELIQVLAGSVRGFALDSGRELWTANGMNPLVYASAVPTPEGNVLATGGYFGSTILLKPGGSGDVTTTHELWYEQRSKRHRIGSPVLKGSRIFLSNTIGVAECLDAATGKSIWDERLPATGGAGETWGSMVRSGDVLYVTNQGGDTFVLQAADRFTLLATNPLGELSNSTPALSGGDVFIRTHQALWCIREGRRLKPANLPGPKPGI